MPGQFDGKYLDELNPDNLTDEQKKALNDLLERDPYAFYNLFKDPDAAQRKIEGDDFQTTPAGKLYTQIGALIKAGAPDNVVQYWQKKLETQGRETEDLSWFPAPKTKPDKAKLKQLDALCDYLNEALNRVDDYSYHPEDEIFPEDNPLNGKWTSLMTIARGEPLVAHRHYGSAKHYRAIDPPLAAGGVEIVEVELMFDKEAVIDIQTLIEEHIQPYAMRAEPIENGVKLIFEFDAVYE